MANALEIEQKFLVDQLPDHLDLSSVPKRHIQQGYFPSDPNRPGTARRIRGEADKGKFEFTVKTRRPDGSKLERNYAISSQRFDQLWPSTRGRIDKVRHLVPHGDRTIELDVFEGNLKGHMLAEVEHPSLEAAQQFTPPPWFGQEVSGDKRFSNDQLAFHGWPEI